MLEEAKVSRGPRTVRALLAAMVVLTLALVGTAGVPAPRAQAAPQDPMENHSLTTYNTQGSKWSEVSGLMRDNDIVAVQESGGVPPRLPVGRNRTVLRDGHIFEATEYRWGEFWIYHLPVPGARNNRTGMAFVTRQRADDFEVLPNTGIGRAGSVGIRFGDTWYYTIHATTGGARGDSLAARRSRNETAMADANAFIEEVARRAQNRQDEWVVMGDFNIDLLDTQALPHGGYVPPAGGRLYNPRVPTHQNDGELDYMVGSRDVPGYGALRGNQLGNGGGSDHYPVRFRSNQVVGDYRPGRRVNLNDTNGNLNVDVFRGEQGHQPGLNYASAGDTNVHQNFYLYPVPWAPGAVQFQNQFDHMCLTAVPNNINAVSHPSDAHIESIQNEPCSVSDERQYWVAPTSHPDEWLSYTNGHITAVQAALQPLVASPFGPYVPLNLK